MNKTLVYLGMGFYRGLLLSGDRSIISLRKKSDTFAQIRAFLGLAQFQKYNFRYGPGSQTNNIGTFETL